ncbi:hypothetical protein WME95_43735 [Sorangium sp. So ce327]|jgi:hypothetical protein|uniref:hypothetical protein n=1 Tax=unclassified Sorangium TaxID=2621164 RepID=UPI003F6396B1
MSSIEDNKSIARRILDLVSEQWSIEDVIAEGDKVVARAEHVRTTELPGHPEPRTAVDATAMAIPAGPPR